MNDNLIKTAKAFIQMKTVYKMPNNVTLLLKN